MEVLGFILSVVSVGLAIWSLMKADGAQKAVSRVLNRSNDQETRDKAHGLLKTLQDARGAAMARRRGASRKSSAGRDSQADLHMLELAQDALATAVMPYGSLLQRDVRSASKELETARLNIADPKDRDGWADALLALQGIIPKVEELERGLARKALAAK